MGVVYRKDREKERSWMMAVAEQIDYAAVTIYRSDDCDSLLRIKLVTLKVRLLLRSLARARLSNHFWREATIRHFAVDKPINTPRISWQACTKRSIQFDQTLSLLRESLARARLRSRCIGRWVKNTKVRYCIYWW